MIVIAIKFLKCCFGLLFELANQINNCVFHDVHVIHVLYCFPNCVIVQFIDQLALDK